VSFPWEVFHHWYYVLTNTRVFLSFQLIMSRRRVPCLDSYLDKVNTFLIFIKDFSHIPSCMGNRFWRQCTFVCSMWWEDTYGQCTEIVLVLLLHSFQQSVIVTRWFILQVNIALWPRFKMVFDMHLTSLRNANVRTLWEDDVHPHYVMRRYAEFTASLLQLNVNYGDGQVSVITACLQRNCCF